MKSKIEVSFPWLFFLIRIINKDLTSTWSINLSRNMNDAISSFSFQMNEFTFWFLIILTLKWKWMKSKYINLILHNCSLVKLQMTEQLSYARGICAMWTRRGVGVRIKSKCDVLLSKRWTIENVGIKKF